MARQLGGDVAGGSRCPGQIAQDGRCLLLPIVGVAAAKHSPHAGFVLVRLKPESLRGVFRRLLAGQRPASQCAGEFQHIGLGIAAAYAQRMQFENFTRQVLVQATSRAIRRFRAGPARGDAVRPGRHGLVEIQQHGRMAHRGEQHILEPPQYMGPDGIGLEAGSKAQHRYFVDRDRKMIGPEVGQTLDERRAALQGTVGARLYAGQIGCPARALVVCTNAGTLRLGCVADGGLLLGPLRHAHRGALDGTPWRGQRLVIIELRQQPAPWIGNGLVVRSRTEAQAVARNGIVDHGPEYRTGTALAGHIGLVGL